MIKIYWWKNYNLLVSTKHFNYNPKIDYIKKLETKIAKILNVKFVAFTTSGSSALTLAFFCANIKKRKKVLIPNRTWVATAHAAYTLGYKIQLADINLNDMCQNTPVNQIMNKDDIGCIVLVNLNGKINKVKNLSKIIKKKKIVVIEDNAQSFLSGEKKKYMNSETKVACYSTGTTKLINTLQGGFCATNDKKI